MLNNHSSRDCYIQRRENTAAEIKHEKKKLKKTFHEITTAKLEKENQTNKQENHNNKERTSTIKRSTTKQRVTDVKKNTSNN